MVELLIVFDATVLPQRAEVLFDFVAEEDAVVFEEF